MLLGWTEINYSKVNFLVFSNHSTNRQNCTHEQKLNMS